MVVTTFLTYPTIYIAGYFPIIFTFLGIEAHSSACLPSFLFSGHMCGILAELRFTYLIDTDRLFVCRGDLFM